MKTLVMIEDGRTQLVLKPDTEHDKDVLQMLSTLPNTYRDTFYQARAGYTRGDDEQPRYYPHFGETNWHTNNRDKDLVIVFDKAATTKGVS